MTLIMVFIFSNPVYSGTPDITFIQDSIILLSKASGNNYEITAGPGPFTILFSGPELNVCAGLDEEVFKAAGSGVDVVKDFNSPFSIFKYAAMPKDGGYLYLYKDGANSLNQSHGAKPYKKGHRYTVSSIMSQGRQKAVGTLEKLYLVLWLDKNRDEFIDDDELYRAIIAID